MNEKNKIAIKAVSFFIAEQSIPENNHYVFAYTITISNQGVNPAKLLHRHWLITDSNGKTREVNGAGVVGEQPYLKPGQNFSYTSGAKLETPVGTMQGYYTMRSDEGDDFNAIIDPFTLSQPGILH